MYPTETALIKVETEKERWRLMKEAINSRKVVPERCVLPGSRNAELKRLKTKQKNLLLEGCNDNKINKIK